MRQLTALPRLPRLPDKEEALVRDDPHVRDMAAESTYAGLPATERLEVRLPLSLKVQVEHFARARHESVTALAIRALARMVAAEALSELNWDLSVPEQLEVLRILARSPRQTPELTKAQADLTRLLGSEKDE